MMIDRLHRELFVQITRQVIHYENNESYCNEFEQIQF